ncbi:MAG TPA: RNA ligase family protein, partial [Desulfosporosinus sp.]|nr:RNA ligase family protein [Desulfosporosinus sp.]
VLKDGTKIKACKLRGAPSYGMALGKTDATVGTDLTAQYEQPTITKRGVNVIKWPEIESLYNVRRGLKQMGSDDRKITYMAKVKLDGTNGGIQLFTDGRIVPQSRSCVLDPDDDNMGFARWTVTMYSYFAKVRELANEIGYKDKHITIFGEWCGRGIQKRTAISEIDRKIFAVFAIQIGGLNEPAKFDVNGLSIQKILPSHNDVFILPWIHGFILDFFILDFSDRAQLERQAEKINQLVEEIEKQDPWVHETFGVDGIGEGVVMYPVDYTTDCEPMFVDRMEYSDLVFKAKGEKHKVVKTKKAAQVDPEVAKNIDEFVTLFVTEPRLEQISEKTGVDNKLTGDFLKAFCGDVKKESVAELEASSLDWKQVAKAVSTAARNWYFKQV